MGDLRREVPWLGQRKLKVVERGMTLIDTARQAKTTYGRKLIKYFYGAKFSETKSFHPYAEISAYGGYSDELSVFASWLNLDENCGAWHEEWYNL